MDHNHWLGMNADHLEQALMRQRALTEQITDAEVRNRRRGTQPTQRYATDAEVRNRRLDAIASMHNYAELLRDAADADVSSPLRGDPQPMMFSFKLELQDGRWDLDEKQLAAPPRVGDVIAFDGDRWRVRASEFVKPRPARRPAREVFVCTLVAA